MSVEVEDEYDSLDDEWDLDEPENVNDEASYPQELQEAHERTAKSPLDVQFQNLLGELRRNAFGRQREQPGIPQQENCVSAMIIEAAVNYCYKTRTTVVRAVGRTALGESVAIFAKGWLAHLTIEAPRRWSSEMNETLAQLLEEKVQTRIYGTPEESRMANCRIVSHISVEMSETIMGYVPGRGKSPYLRIHLNHPDAVGPMRDCFHGYSIQMVDSTWKKSHGIRVHVDAGTAHLAPGVTQTFNSNIEPRLQAMVDLDIHGGQWVSVPDKHLSQVTRTTCDMEVDTDIEYMKWHDVEEFPGLAPLREVSFDIEARGRKGVFPDAQQDPVIMIGIHFSIIGVAEEHVPQPIILCMRECNPIDGATVVCYSDEQEGLMIRDAARIMGGCVASGWDADVVRGWNINNFDLPYLEGRAKKFGVEDDFMRIMSRINRNPMRVIEAFEQTAQSGRKQCNKFLSPGRIGGDMIVYVAQEKFKLKNLKLDTVAAEFLGDHKEDVHFTKITPMWEEGVVTRTQLCVYCLKDAKLPSLLARKLNATLNVIERSRITGVPCDWVLRRGNMSRCNSLLCRQAKGKYVIPYSAPTQQGAQQRQQAGYQGATVIEPKKGKYVWVCVFDFNSMYPNIISKYNLCYTTYTKDGTIPNAFSAVKGHYFVQAETRKGVVPEIVEMLLMERKKAKAALAEATDPMTKQILKAREQAFKVTGNSVYGYLGSKLAQVPFQPIAETTTAVGRRDNAHTQRIVKELFTPANGFPGSGVEIVGGDTDSVFVCMEGLIPNGTEYRDALTECIRLADIAVRAINAEIALPTKIEFEKVYSVILLICKKRYAGMKHEDDVRPPVVDMRGVECVRGGGVPLVNDLVRDVLNTIVHTGDTNDAAAIVRKVVDDVITDAVPLEKYTITQVLRKGKVEYSKPLSQDDVKKARSVIKSQRTEPQLTYSELDQLIRAGVDKVPRFITSGNIQPQAVVAWEQRLRDPGSAPVPGENVQFVISMNGKSEKISDKAMSPADLERTCTQVDRKYYLDRIQNAMNRIFGPMFDQLAAQQANTDEERMRSAELNKRKLLWPKLSNPLQTSHERKRQLIEGSAIWKAFARQRTSP